jgi:hypothetical protein
LISFLIREGKREKEREHLVGYDDMALCNRAKHCRERIFIIRTGLVGIRVVPSPRELVGDIFTSFGLSFIDLRCVP